MSGSQANPNPNMYNMFCIKYINKPIQLLQCSNFYIIGPCDRPIPAECIKTL
jgi:hypothetical protein